MSTSFKVACVQMAAGREFAPNIEKLSVLIQLARKGGADLITLPEAITMIEPVAEKALAKALPEDRHPGLAALREAARETGAWILIGSLNIRHDSGKVANRSFLLDSEGAIVARYDKIHLFDVKLANGETYRESATVEPGTKAVLAPTPWGLLGMSVCYDLRFPHLYRDLAKAGASYLTIPSAFTLSTGQVHWHALVRVRAIETGSFIFAPAQGGSHAEGRKTYGHSLIVDPWGEMLADGGTDEGVIIAEIDPAKVAEARARIPALAHDRPYDAPTDATADRDAAE